MSPFAHDLERKIEAVLPAFDNDPATAAHIHRDVNVGALGTISNTLRRLERSGRVQSILVQNSKGHRQVRLYRRAG